MKMCFYLFCEMFKKNKNENKNENKIRKEKKRNKNKCDVLYYSLEDCLNLVFMFKIRIFVVFSVF